MCFKDCQSEFVLKIVNQSLFKDCQSDFFKDCQSDSFKDCQCQSEFVLWKKSSFFNAG